MRTSMRSRMFTARRYDCAVYIYCCRVVVCLCLPHAGNVSQVCQLTPTDRATLPHAQSTITLYTELTKVLNSNSDLHTHSKSLAGIHSIGHMFVYISLPLQLSPIMHSFRDIVAYFPKFKDYIYI